MVLSFFFFFLQTRNDLQKNNKQPSILYLVLQKCLQWKQISLVTLGGLVGLGERQAGVSRPSNERQDPSVRNDVPGQRQGDVFIRSESISIVEKEVFGFHVSESQFGVFSSKNDLIPQHDLVQSIVLCCILGREIKKQLFDIPVENRL